MVVFVGLCSLSFVAFQAKARTVMSTFYNAPEAWTFWNDDLLLLLTSNSIEMWGQTNKNKNILFVMKPVRLWDTNINMEQNYNIPFLFCLYSFCIVILNQRSFWSFMCLDLVLERYSNHLCFSFCFIRLLYLCMLIWHCCRLRLVIIFVNNYAVIEKMYFIYSGIACIITLLSVDI